MTSCTIKPQIISHHSIIGPSSHKEHLKIQKETDGKWDKRFKELWIVLPSGWLQPCGQGVQGIEGISPVAIIFWLCTYCPWALIRYSFSITPNWALTTSLHWRNCIGQVMSNAWFPPKIIQEGRKQNKIMLSSDQIILFLTFLFIYLFQWQTKFMKFTICIFLKVIIVMSYSLHLYNLI